MSDFLFLAVLIFFFMGGVMWLITFILCFAFMFWLIKTFVRQILEAEAPPNFPKGIPFPLWMHGIFAFVTTFPAWVFAESIVWGLK